MLQGNYGDSVVVRRRVGGALPSYDTGFSTFAIKNGAVHCKQRESTENRERWATPAIRVKKEIEASTGRMRFTELWSASRLPVSSQRPASSQLAASSRSAAASQGRRFFLHSDKLRSGLVAPSKRQKKSHQLIRGFASEIEVHLAPVALIACQGSSVGLYQGNKKVAQGMRPKRRNSTGNTNPEKTKDIESRPREPPTLPDPSSDEIRRLLLRSADSGNNRRNSFVGVPLLKKSAARSLSSINLRSRLDSASSFSSSSSSKPEFPAVPLRGQPVHIQNAPKRCFDRHKWRPFDLDVKQAFVLENEGLGDANDDDDDDDELETKLNLVLNLPSTSGEKEEGGSARGVELGSEKDAG